MPRWLPDHLFPATDAPRRSYSHSVGKVPSKEKHVGFDLCTADGRVATLTTVDFKEIEVIVSFDEISSRFLSVSAAEGVALEFNLKSSLTQLGIDAADVSINVDAVTQSATASLKLQAHTAVGVDALQQIAQGSFIGKLFARDPRRLIVNMDYITRLQDAVDFQGHPLLHYEGAEPWKLEMVGGRVVAFVPLHEGKIEYDDSVRGLIPTVASALKMKTNYKPLLRLHQQHVAGPRIANNGSLLVRSSGLELVTMFARVVPELLPEGLRCAHSNILEPETGAPVGGRTFVFTGHSKKDLTHIPLEFFSLEAYREHVPFSLRKTLATKSQDVNTVLKAFESAPEDGKACTFVCKGSMFDHLHPEDWITANPVKDPYVVEGEVQQKKAEAYLFQQCEYGLLSAIAVGEVTSDGVMLTKYFPSPVLKSLLLSRQVIKKLHAIYFLQASRDYGSFLSQDDRSLLNDLNTFGIEVFHVDAVEKKMYQFTRRPSSDSGLMVPLGKRQAYLNATVFGVYGSNLVAGNFEQELDILLKGVAALKATSTHPKLNKDTPLALVTGGGPGAMEVGNRVAINNQFLSCGMFVDFGSLARKPGANINEQKKNPYVEAYMTYRPSKLVERQSEFNLDFPIFLTGGIGTDFEYALEEVRRKVGTVDTNPMILFGSPEHWGAKMTGRFQENGRCGTIKGSEWLSNVPYVVQTGAQALAVYKKFFNGTLEIGGKAPAHERGFVVVDDAFVASANM